MIVLKFRSSEEHEELMKKVKKMKKFTDEILECLEEKSEGDDYSFRGGYRREMMEDEPEYRGGRYGYRGMR